MIEANSLSLFSIDKDKYQIDSIDRKIIPQSNEDMLIQLQNIIKFSDKFVFLLHFFFHTDSIDGPDSKQTLAFLFC